MKKMSENIILHKHTKNHDHMLYCFWDMVHDRCKCYFSFWAIFCPFTPLAFQKMKIKKKMNKKLNWRYHRFIHVYPKLWSCDAQFQRYGVWKIDRWTKKVKEVVALPKNCSNVVSSKYLNLLKYWIEDKILIVSSDCFLMF